MVRAAKTQHRKKAIEEQKEKKRGSHPTFHEMIVNALTGSATKGLSRQAIKRTIVENYPIDDSPDFEENLRDALHHAMESGDLIHPRGHKGSYQIAKHKQFHVTETKQLEEVEEQEVPNAPKPPKVHHKKVKSAPKHLRPTEARRLRKSIGGAAVQRLKVHR